MNGYKAVSDEGREIEGRTTKKEEATGVIDLAAGGGI